jgi:hypothetical protein
MWATGAEEPERRTESVGFRFFAGYFAPFLQGEAAIIVFGFLFFLLDMWIDSELHILVLKVMES